MSKKNKIFLWKITRNAVILTGAFFFAMYSTNEIDYGMIKALVVFLGTYVFTELMHKYNINGTTNVRTLIF